MYVHSFWHSAPILPSLVDVLLHWFWLPGSQLSGSWDPESSSMNMLSEALATLLLPQILITQPTLIGQHSSHSSPYPPFPLPPQSKRGLQANFLLLTYFAPLPFLLLPLPTLPFHKPPLGTLLYTILTPQILPVSSHIRSHHTPVLLCLLREVAGTDGIVRVHVPLSLQHISKLRKAVGLFLC